MTEAKHESDPAPKQGCDRLPDLRREVRELLEVMDETRAETACESGFPPARLPLCQSAVRATQIPVASP